MLLLLLIFSTRLPKIQLIQHDGLHIVDCRVWKQKYLFLEMVQWCTACSSFSDPAPPSQLSNPWYKATHLPYMWSCHHPVLQLLSLLPNAGNIFLSFVFSNIGINWVLLICIVSPAVLSSLSGRALLGHNGTCLLSITCQTTFPLYPLRTV